MCDRAFPICEIHLSFDGGICCTPDRRINSFLLWCDSLYNCQIGTPDLAMLHLGRENCCTIRIFRQDQGSCGAVSYTHLDVYKRQDVASKPMYNNMAIGMYAGNSGNSLYCPTGYLELLRDVYKRQQ